LSLHEKSIKRGKGQVSAVSRDRDHLQSRIDRTTRRFEFASKKIVERVKLDPFEFTFIDPISSDERPDLFAAAWQLLQIAI
jgi:hypothetical protein